MKKLLLALLAVLLFAGIAFAVSIPQSEDPKNGSQVTTVPVFNNSGSSIAAGSVVVWDIDSSTGDNDNWITTTTTNDTHVVAGVVFPSACATADTCTIAVRGVVDVNIGGYGAPGGVYGGGTVEGSLCTSPTAGKARNCVNESNRFGFVTQAVSSGVVKAFINTL